MVLSYLNKNSMQGRFIHTRTYVYYFWKYSLDFQTVVVFKDKIKLQSQKSIISLAFPNQIEASCLIKLKTSILHTTAILILLYWEGSRLFYHRIAQSGADVSSTPNAFLSLPCPFLLTSIIIFFDTMKYQKAVRSIEMFLFGFHL